MKLTPREARIRRHKRVRSRVVGTALRPRLSVFRSLNHIYAQIIDDEQGHTLADASTLDPEIRKDGEKENKTKAAQKVGALVAQRALAKEISQVLFDRGGYRYHGRIKALAESAREKGLKF